MPDWIPKPDVEFVAFADRVVSALEADEAAYGLVAADTLSLRAALTQLSNALGASNVAKNNATTAVAAKDARRAEFEGLLRPIVQRVQVNPNVTDAQRTAAALPIRDTVRTVSAPIAPRDLVAVSDGSGVNSLKWNANGNSSGVEYVVEAKVGPALDFSTVDVTRATSYRHSGRTVGQLVNYRVRARRGAALSEPSNVAGVHV
jgi:hypothetical protein